MSEEKIVKINGIQISKTGFKNLQFETSRTSDRLETIRGFGGLMRERNLNVIDTVSMDFVLNYYELKELAYIYCLFKANGILPLENEYFLKKIKSTYEEGKTEEEIRKDPFIKENVSHLICFLEKLSLTSIDRTNNAYKINMVLTLYDNAMTKEEFELYMEKYKSWNKETGFEELCNENIEQYINSLKELSNLEIKIYNIETLNSTYKEHLLNNAAINAKLNSDNEDVNEQKATTYYEKSKMDLLKNKDTLDISKLGTTVSIPNHSILQIELITNNNISNIPIIGSPIGSKSYLGIGQTFFSAKLIFNEYENDVVESLKRISDKNIINHKVELNHPLIQLFDFHTSNIVNIIFNNLEEANGIMVNIIFSLNGFRYSEEATINTEDIINDVKYDNNFKQEEIGGLYLEFLSDYLYKNRKTINSKNVETLMKFVLETKVVNNDGEDNNAFSRVFTHNYPFVNLLSSYSSLPTSFGIHNYSDNTLLYPSTLFVTEIEKELMNTFFNKDVQVADDMISTSDFFYLDYAYTINKNIKDSKLNVYRGLYNGTKYYSYIDNLSAITIFGNLKYRQKISNYLYSNIYSGEITKSYSFKYIINEVIKKLSVELFNTKQNGDLDIYKNEVYKKLYEEFFYRAFYILNYTLSSKVQELKETSFISSNEYSILFSEIYKTISELSDSLYQLFIETLYDGDFLERITKEIISENLSAEEQLNVDREKKIKDVKDNVITFTLEFVNNYEFNKERIKTRAYNIFLSKLNYLLYHYNFDGQKYEEKFGFDIDGFIRTYILSSALHSILLNYTSTRTDHFDNSVILGFKNIGYKISKYNYNLERNSDGSICMFYDLFKNDNKPNNFLYYKDKVEYDDFKYHEKTIFNSIPNKDINFFYGSKIEIMKLYSQLIELLVPDNIKNEETTLRTILENEKERYINSDDYSETTLDIDGINFPFMNFGYIPTRHSELFYEKENNKYTMNNVMKQRVIGNRDVFRDIEEISSLVFDYGNSIMPDYNVLIIKKDYDKTSSGNTYKTTSGEKSISLKNVSSVNLVKNPKTKIKTLNLVLTDVSKSIFNFDPVNGSFDIKTLESGKIDIIHIEPGDEIRLNLGFDNKVQIFNGFINMIETVGNQLILACSSYTSALYNNKISNLELSSNGLWRVSSVISFFKSMLNKTKTTLTEIQDKVYENIRNSYASIKPLNDHLFVLNNKNYNEVFKENEKASMYSAFSLSLSSVPTAILEKFVNRKAEDIAQSKLATETYNKKSLEAMLGSMSITPESIGTTSDLYKNINNVDRDYENYGMIYIKSDSPYFYNYQETYKNSDTASNKETEIKEQIQTTIKAEEIGDYENDGSDYGITNIPVNQNTNVITSLYKERRVKNNEYTYHKGIDICNPTSSKELDYIYAVADGKVILSSFGKDSGNYIKILHKIPNQEKYFMSCYMHLSERDVIQGAEVTAGTKIGIMGNTGYSSGKHLHFEMYMTNSNGTSKYSYLNPFDENMLPDNNWNVDWNLVNVSADNGRYTEEWKEAYSNAKKIRRLNG